MVINAPSPANTSNTPAGPSAVRPEDKYMMLPRWFAAAAGAWLFASVFIWDHLPTVATSTMIVGALIAAVAVSAMWWPRVRFVNTLAAAWLFASALVLEHAYRFTVWHDIMLSVIVLAASLSPAAPRRHRLDRSSTGDTVLPTRS